MIYPKFIKEGDTIGVTAPSDGISKEIDLVRLNKAIKNLEDRGLKIKTTLNCYTSKIGRSSSANDRAKQLEQLFLDKEIKAIICLSGGEFLVEMLSFLDYEIIKNNPKWIMGLSDPTGLLFTFLTICDLSTIHFSNFKNYSMKPWHISLENSIEILRGNIITQDSFDLYQKGYQEHITGDEPLKLDSKVKWINLNGENKITIKGRIIGGNIDIIGNIIGTRFDKVSDFLEKYKNDGIIWYFDNCELSQEDIIRTMWQFKEAEYFKYVKGIIFGRSANESSYFNLSFKDTLKEALNSLNIPVIMNVDIGHLPPNLTIINGALAKISSANGKGKIELILK